MLRNNACLSWGIFGILTKSHKIYKQNFTIIKKTVLKELRHDDFPVLGQLCVKSITYCL